MKRERNTWEILGSNLYSLVNKVFMKGRKINKLSSMIPGEIYMLADLDKDMPKLHGTDKMEDSQGNTLYTFVFLKSQEVGKDCIYECDLLEAPEGESLFKLFETLDQAAIDAGTAILYKLSEL